MAQMLDRPATEAEKHEAVMAHIRALIRQGESDGLEDTQACRVCGCSNDHACPEGCYWVEEDLCSVCASRIVVLVPVHQ